MKLTFSVVACLLLCLGCGKKQSESRTLPLPPALEQRVQEEAKLNSVVEGDTTFAVDLYHQLCTASGNVFFSPYSLSSALAMTYAGARGRTEEQMAKTMHFELPQEELHSVFAKLQTSLNAAQQSNTVQLSVANSLWPAQGLSLQPDFLDRVERNYRTRIMPLDYGQGETARLTINGWVEDRTRDKIKDLIQRDELGPDTVLVLANAIYFKGAWATPFKPENTVAMPFHLTSTSKVNTPMMHGRLECGYRANEDLEILELPYKGDRLSMVILLPKKVDGLAELEQALTAPELAESISTLRKEDLDVWLPKFKTTSEFRLSKTLKAMGMVDAFTGAADFSGMFGSRGPSISTVAHKAFVEVNEVGTEAAAATGVIMRSSAPRTFRVDHPFLYLIRDRDSGSILFMGRITDPRQ